MRRRSLTLLVGLSMALTGVGAATAVASTTAHSTTAHAASARAAVKAHSSKYGHILFAKNGDALYSFARDHGSKSSCYGACAKTWPPLLTKGRPSAGSGARAKLLGTTKRKDGTLQVTYAGKPLYYFTGDTAPGQINCQNVSLNGGKWYVVSAAGKAIH